jgi:hypothetical protein
LWLSDVDCQVSLANNQEVVENPAIRVEEIVATARLPRLDKSEEHVPAGKKLIAFDEALEVLSSDEAFKATVYSMNTLLIEKGIYSPEEFRFHFRQSAQKQLRKRAKP